MKLRLLFEFHPEAKRWSAVFPELAGCASAGDAWEEAVATPRNSWKCGSNLSVVNSRPMLFAHCKNTENALKSRVVSKELRTPTLNSQLLTLSSKPLELIPQLLTPSLQLLTLKSDLTTET